MRLTKEETRTLVAWFGGLSKLTGILFSVVALVGIVSDGLDHIYIQLALMQLSILCAVTNIFSIGFNTALLQFPKDPPKEYDLSLAEPPNLTETVKEPPQTSIRQRAHIKAREE